MPERHMIPAVDVIKIIAFEAEPVIDRVHYTYTLVFTVDKNNVRWKVTHQFSRFKILNLLIRKLAPKLIYSKFPKDSTTTLLGLRVSKKAVDNRRLMLDMWIREVVANFEIFPEEIAQSLTDFIKAPKKVTTLLEKSFSSNSDENPSNFFSATVGTVVGRGSSSNHIIAGSTHDGKKYANSQPPTAPKKKQRIELIIKSMTQLCSKIASRLNVHLNTKFQGTVTVCISRTEKVVTINRINSPGIFLGELLQHLTCYGQIYVIITVLNNVIWSLLFVWVDISCSSAVVLLLASFAMYFQLVKSDYAEDNEITAYTPSHLTVQNTLRKFLNSPHLEYSDKIYSFPCFLAYSGHNSHGSKSDSDDESFSSDDLADIMSEEESPHQNHNKSLTKSLASPLFLGHSAGSKFWTQPEESRNPSGSNLMVNVIEKCEPPLLHESLVPGSTYDNVEFNDLCAEARAMFSDRSETHTMKVRGDSYCEDNKKVHPGHAMSKLLLLELFEVEPKDGDRHDHIVSRGAAMRRLQALRTLPEKLFFIVVNHQIPGDPPVSIVAYYGLPMDLIDRYPGSATLKFLKSFERFIDIPRTEKERLEAWGIYSTDADVNDTVNEKERVRETEKTKSGDGDLEISVTSPESLSGKYSTGSETMSQSGIKHPSVSSLSQAPTTANKQISATVASQVAATVNRPPDSPRHSIMSPPKKSRLGALLARTSSGMGSRPVSTNIMSSPRHKAAVAAAAAALKEEIQAPAPVPLSRQIMIAATCRGRSSSFNDAPDSVIVIAETPILSKTLSLTLPDHSLTSPAVSAENSPVATSRKTSKSPRNHCADLSEDNRFRDTGDSVVHNSLAHAHAHASTHTSSTSTSTSSHSVATIAPTSASVPPQALSSSGWKIPSDITWPTAYDKGSLPPSDYRNERMKLIPSITLGPWVVKAAVGATPVLLGRKVVQRYFRGEDYMEIDIHIGSSVIAAQITGMCRGYAKNIINDLGIVIQGEHEGELPERLLAAGALNRINVSIRQKLD